MVKKQQSSEAGKVTAGPAMQRTWITGISTYMLKASKREMNTLPMKLYGSMVPFSYYFFLPTFPRAQISCT